MIKSLADPDEEVSHQAVMILGTMGPEAAPAIPPLLAFQRPSDAYGRQAVAQVLAAIGKPAVPSLLEVLQKEDDPSLRAAAAYALGGLGRPIEPTAIPALIAALRDKDERVRSAAAFTLAAHRPVTDKALPALSSSRSTPQASCRESARRLCPLSSKRHGTNRGDFRLRVALVIDGIAPTTEGLVPALVAAMRDPDVDVRILAAQALGRMGERVVPDLIAALEDTDAEMRRLSGATLGSMGPAARAAVPALIKHSKSKTDGWWAAEAVLRIDPKAAAAAGITEGN